ncbi:serine/threonine protein kinase [bacterium]|nr:serine/threonine protein kinase [bacterium]
MEKISLPRAIWYYDPSKLLGPEGGFGAVYYGESENGNRVAVKKLKVDAESLGHRELRVADYFVGKSFSNIIPIYDSGQDTESNSYYIIMAHADYSLDSELWKNEKYDAELVVEILDSIIIGMSEVPDLIHRDLKPANVLNHEGKWKVADFGIARFIEESTSLQTLGGFLSCEYAAPEQWNFLKSSQKTDIYALGCIGYALLTGTPPFSGPETSDFKKQHLEVVPAIIEKDSHLLCSLISFMLRKPPGSRPDYGRIRELLEKIRHSIDDSDSGEPILAKLQQVGRTEVEAQALKEAETIRVEEKRQQRVELAAGAWNILVDIISKLFGIIDDNVLTAQVFNGSDINLRQTSTISVGNVELSIVYLIELGLSYQNGFVQSGWDALAGATILIHQKNPFNKCGASLWYMKRSQAEDYRWYEVSYSESPFLKKHRDYAPFELKSVVHADEAATRTLGSEYLVAHGPELIDDECEESFIQIWLERFVQAARGELQSRR